MTEQEYYNHELKAATREYLDSDPLANYTGYLGNTKIGLTYFVNNKAGSIKDSFTVKEAQFLMQGRMPKTVINGRVPKEVALDCLAAKFNITEEELEERILHIANCRRAM